ncbi:hypothetical protein KI387_034977 [Taxus chinensis]|uniref:Uncharacterized protein n=1 Tax=Taxus chinensis TaxID=29808 RepID=A0AA38F6J9_TAXCH|nr:hypothetical protein KI387_034977 [Taxus chinensis]
MKNPEVAASFPIEEREGDEGRHEERDTNTIDGSTREVGTGLAFPNGVEVSLMLEDMVFGRGLVCDSIPNENWHGITLPKFIVKVIISEAIVSTAPLPYPNTFSNTLAKCVKGVAIWDLSDIRLDTPKEESSCNE